MANTILVNGSDKYFEPAAKDRYSYLKQNIKRIMLEVPVISYAKKRLGRSSMSLAPCHLLNTSYSSRIKIGYTNL